MSTLIAGYYGFDNVGDELLLTSVLHALRPTGRITVLSHRPARTRLEHDVESVSRWNPVSVLVALRRADRLVFGGGGIFQDKTSRRSLGYYLALLRAARILGKPVTLCAVGVDPISSARLRNALGRALSGETLEVSVRDDVSAAAVVACGAARPAVAADLVFALPDEIGAPQATVDLLVVVRSAGARPREPWEWILEGALPRSWSTAMAAFQPGADARLSGELASAFPQTSSLGVLQFGDAKAAVARASRVVSGRFHALVLAAKAGRPFAGVGADAKIESLCRAFGMPFLPMTAGEGETLETLGRLASAPAPARATVERFRDGAAKALSSLAAHL
ncbi:MAG: polysaccharide pyruvyl transferase CsaB [Elusimicrobia bacterium]|nr:polysaccharide pyruvyl transferase CsaB [Elusimicrobiota bacterium]